MNGYVAGGYGAAAGILGAYAVYVRHRVRTLIKAAPPEPTDPNDAPAEGS